LVGLNTCSILDPPGAASWYAHSHTRRHTCCGFFALVNQTLLVIKP
jgi:hypothetical protein